MNTLYYRSTLLAALVVCFALTSCSSTKQGEKQENDSSAPAAVKSSSDRVTPPQPGVLPGDIGVDKPDSNGIVHGRYYGEELNVILGRTVRWCVENSWDILNDGAGANGTVVAHGNIRGFQRVIGTPDLGQKAEYLCADCGTDDKGQLISETGTMVVKVKTLALGKTKLTVDFTPDAPPNKPNQKCKTTGKFEQLIMNYLLHD